MEPVAYPKPKCLLAVAAAVLAISAWGQTASLEAPVLGYAFDVAAGSIRPILGVPGAARFEVPYRSEEALRHAVPAPWRDYALADMDGAVRIVRWENGNVSSRPLGDLPALPERMAFSPAGASVALDTGGEVQIWGGMPDAARLVRTIPYPSAIDALAVTDDGTAVAVASAGGVRLYDSIGSRLVAEGGRFSSLAFARDSRELAMADLERDLVLVAGAGVVSRDFEKPSSVAFSADGRKLVVASAARSKVALIELASRETVTLACDCGIETLERARGNAVFRLTEGAKGRAPMLDGDSAEPRIVFVAAAEEAK